MKKVAIDRLLACVYVAVFVIINLIVNHCGPWVIPITTVAAVCVNMMIRDFQVKAAYNAKIVEKLANMHNVPWMVENPVGALSTLWRKPDFIFNPCAYGGYLPEDDNHPAFPDVYPPRDAYTKKNLHMVRQRI
ncbi:hypothetical protein [Escherichia coli]|uniref:hypothetical protein n=1 Tax=Escherichia coli TaxID=562 RepID=UPI0023EC347F|nr:hypothetical protein [Escherichia coli]